MCLCGADVKVPRKMTNEKKITLLGPKKHLLPQKKYQAPSDRFWFDQPLVNEFSLVETSSLLFCVRVGGAGHTSTSRANGCGREQDAIKF